MSIRIYNTLTRVKEDFIPLEANTVKMYVCGPTVYDFLHIGNFVGPIFFNLVRNWLEAAGYTVTYVYNFTDVDDRIIDRAKKDGRTSAEVSEQFIAEFWKDFLQLKLKPHSKNPKVTEYMTPIVDFVGKLIEKGVAYTSAGDVYFSVEKFENYGKLSNKNIEQLMAGHRIDVSEKKNHVADFALWKKAKPGEPSWKAPWGEGRPGWHIECSAMNHAIFGDQIDIHGGGIDLTFPHHENEIAQTEALTGKSFARYWMHNNLLHFGQTKMSKSVGNIRTARSFLQEYGGEVLKFFVLSNHYRSPIEFNDEQIRRAISSLGKFYSALVHAAELSKSAPLAPVPEGFEQALARADKNWTDALNDDFNSSKAFAELYEILRLYNSIARKPGRLKPEEQAVAAVFIAWLKNKGLVLSLFQEEPIQFLRTMDDLLLRQKEISRTEIDSLVAARSDARNKKDFKTADELRKKLVDLGISLQDSAAGTHWEVDKGLS
jgi:cysteinyl-tRNA synthetase